MAVLTIRRTLRSDKSIGFANLMINPFFFACAMIALIFFPIASHQKNRLADLLSMSCPQLLPNYPGKHSMTIALFLDGNPQLDCFCPASSAP